MKKSNTAGSVFGLSRNLPRKHIKGLWFIALLVIGLPLLAFAASLTTNLTPKAYLPTPTRTITPIPPVTITDSPTRNIAPKISTTTLPAGNINSTYEGYVDATDANKTDELTMTMSGLPFGLSQGPCASLAPGGRITCYITGTPSNTGIYSVKINVKDNHGGSTDKSLTLSVYEGRPSPTPLFTPIVPPPAD